MSLSRSNVELELGWPIVMLAALLTAAIAVLAAGIHYVTQPIVTPNVVPALERALYIGQPEFDQFREQIVIEQLVGKEKVHPLNNLSVEITALVRNNTGRKITGLEMRGAIRDAQNSTVRDWTNLRRQSIFTISRSPASNGRSFA